MKILHRSSEKLVLDATILFGVFGRDVYTFDKAKGVLIIEHSGVRAKVPLTDILAAVDFVDTIGEGSEYCIELVRTHEKRIRLPNCQNLSAEEIRYVARKIREFLNAASNTPDSLPPQSVPPPLPSIVDPTPLQQCAGYSSFAIASMVLGILTLVFGVMSQLFLGFEGPFVLLLGLQPHYSAVVIPDCKSYSPMALLRVVA